MASTPVIAVIAGGKPSVRSASSTATSGSNTGEDTPALVVAPVVMTATGVTSEPVPAVVGTRIRGRREPLTWSTPYKAGRSWLPASSTATTFATSMELPPPTAMTASTRSVTPSFDAASTTASGGSSLTWSKTTGLRPAFTKADSTGAIRPIATRPGSVTSSGCLTSSRSHSSASCKELPAPLTMRGAVLKTKVFIGTPAGVNHYTATIKNS